MAWRVTDMRRRGTHVEGVAGLRRDVVVAGKSRRVCAKEEDERGGGSRACARLSLSTVSFL